MKHLEIKKAKGWGCIEPSSCKSVQLTLFDFDFSKNGEKVIKRVNYGLDTPFSLFKLKQDCHDWANRNFKKFEDEDDEEFKQRLVDEGELEFADRLRKIADAVETIVYSRK